MKKEWKCGDWECGDAKYIPEYAGRRFEWAEIDPALYIKMDWDQYIKTQESQLFEKDPLYGSAELLQRGGSYVLTQETERMLKRISPVNSDPIRLDHRVITTFDQAIAQAVASVFLPKTVLVVKEEPFYALLARQAWMAIRQSTWLKAEVINVDRFILPQYGNVGVDYSELSIGRVITDSGEPLVARPADPPLQVQLARIAQRIKMKGINNIIIVDDGFSSLEALEPYKNIADQMGWNIVGFTVGVCPIEKGEWAKTKELAEKISGNPVSFVLPVSDIVDWTCQRDFSIFGGKMVESSSYPLSAPYFFPFSDGASGSIPKEQLLAFSKPVLQANALLIAALNTTRSRPLTFADALAAGYGIPTSLLGAIRTPEPNEQIGQFLEEAIQTL